MDGKIEIQHKGQTHYVDGIESYHNLINRVTYEIYCENEKSYFVIYDEGLGCGMWHAHSLEQARAIKKIIDTEDYLIKEKH